MENVLENVALIKGAIADFINAEKERVEALLAIVPFRTRLQSRLDLERYYTEHPEREIEPLELALVDTIFLEEAMTDDFDRTAEVADVLAYAEIFCRFMNSVYGQKDKQFFPRRIAFAPAAIEVEFYYGAPEPVQTLNFADAGNKPATGEPLYAKNIIWFRKPAALRYWLRLQGVADADRVFAAAIEAGY